MAMGECRECGKQASSEAKACPHCGATDPVQKKVGPVGVIAALFLGFVIFKVYPSGDDAPKPAPQATNYDTAETANSTCRQFIKRGANDPSSIDFVDYLSWPANRTESGAWAVTATFRGKNGFGAVVLNRKVCEVKIVGDTARVVALK